MPRAPYGAPPQTPPQTPPSGRQQGGGDKTSGGGSNHICMNSGYAIWFRRAGSLTRFLGLLFAEANTCRHYAMAALMEGEWR